MPSTEYGLLELHEQDVGGELWCGLKAHYVCPCAFLYTEVNAERLIS